MSQWYYKPNDSKRTAYDGDPNYLGGYTLVTPNGIVNADINGSVYNYTYTAVADTAGNPGASVSRIIGFVVPTMNSLQEPPINVRIVDKYYRGTSSRPIDQYHY